MSTANTITVPSNGNLNVKLVTWPALANGEAGAPIAADQALWSDRSVQVVGTFGAAGSVSIEGSNDGVNYFVLNSPQGTALTFAAAGLKQVLEGTLFLRPRVTAGDGTTNLQVTLMLRLPTQRQN